MTINTDLNTSPYFDDYRENKQFNRILIRPSRAIQARELNQIQSILQNQIERLSSNVYKENTIISGVNPTEETEVFYVKIRDQANLNDLSSYAPDNDNTPTHLLVGKNTGLQAEIVETDNGFETTSPNLKTFYIKYTNTGINNESQFQAGEPLTVKRMSDNEIVLSVTTAPIVNNPIGRSFGILIQEGVIYSKGHFIFTKEQFVIVSKYSGIPSNVSVGLDVVESIVNSNQDSSLLDNSSGFNNENAPGADRLKLEPILKVFPSSSEPAEFFSLIRYSNGNAVTIRDVTEFGSIATELARRTFDESGNYVVRGMELSLEGVGDTVNVSISPGKAYVKGYELTLSGKSLLPITPSTNTDIKELQSSPVFYSGELVANTISGSNIDLFSIGTSIRYPLKDNAGVKFAECSVVNIEQNKIFINAVKKSKNISDNSKAQFIGDVPVTEKTLNTCLLFPASELNVKGISNQIFKRRNFTSDPSANSIILTATSTRVPQPYNIFGVTANGEVMNITDVSVNSNTQAVTVSFDNQVNAGLYYDEIITDIRPDILTEELVYIKTTDSSNNAGVFSLGLPNVVEIIEVLDDFGIGTTNLKDKFRLYNNQKDGFYDISYLRLLPGEILPNSNLRVRMRVLRRTFQNSERDSKYLDASSYDTVNRRLLKTYTSKKGNLYNLTSSIDFRPYARLPGVGYVKSLAETIPSITQSYYDNEYDPILIDQYVVPANRSSFFSTQEVYLDRVDSVRASPSGIIEIQKGTPSDRPTPPQDNEDIFRIGEIFVPGAETLSTNQLRPIRLRDVSNRRYTMKDIESIDTRLAALAETVSLTLLETDTQNLFISDGSGNDRFKNGILVDNFETLNIADLDDVQYNARISTTEKTLTPRVRNYFVDLKVENEVDTTALSDVRALNSTTTTIILNQPFATGSRPCVSDSNVFSGRAQLSPQYETSYDTGVSPSYTIPIGHYTPDLRVVDQGNLNEYFDILGYYPFDGYATYGLYQYSMPSQLNGTLSRYLSAVNYNNIKYSTHITYNPYVAEDEIKILATGLRPNRIHYFFFDGQNVSANVNPGFIVDSSDPNNLISSNVKVFNPNTNVVTTDKNGILKAVFRVPANTFRTGELVLEIADVQNYSDIGVSVSSTSYARVPYFSNYSKFRESLTTNRTDINTTQSTTAKSIPFINNNIVDYIDPISQTFFIKRGMAQGANALYVRLLNLYFNTKTEGRGITVELREIVNGFPSSLTLPYGSKYIPSEAIFTSEDGTVPTEILFDNPVKLNVEKEYCFVITPDGLDRGFRVFTSTLGLTNIADSSIVTQDWGDGRLFIPSNSKSWISSPNEDIKFNLSVYDFSTSNGKIDLVPNDPEFMTLVSDSTVNNFNLGECVYQKNGEAYSATVDNSVASRNVVIVQKGIGTPPSFVSGDSISIRDTETDIVSMIAKIVSVQDNTTSSSEVALTLDTALYYSSSFVVQSIVEGTVEYYSPTRRNLLNLKKSSARPGNVFSANSTIYGSISGTTRIISSIDDITPSFFEPRIIVDADARSNYDLNLISRGSVVKGVEPRTPTYITEKAVTIVSKSNISSGLVSSQDFGIRVDLSNSGFEKVSPLVDSSASKVNVYQYFIDDSINSSSYVAKIVNLDDDLSAQGIRVLLTAFRPAGTEIDVYARFIYKDNPDELSDYVQLTQKVEGNFSNSRDIADFKDFEYNLANETSEYDAFQIKIVMRHSYSFELNNLELSIIPKDNIFPIIRNMRAIALT